jgi:multidrug efflux pump subunit AcrA (membrane-fusion protein)
MKKIWVFVGCLIIAAAAAWQFSGRIPYLSDMTQNTAAGEGAGQQGRRRSNGPPPVVKTVAASRTVLPMDVTATGSADADENTTIAAQQAGIIVSIAAHDGAVVRAGDLLAKPDDRTAKAALDISE